MPRGKSYSRSRKNFKSARAAWTDIRKRRPRLNRSKIKRSHTKTSWRWVSK